MQTENLFTPNKIRLFSGHYFDPFDPDPAAMSIENIAHGLSNICRFGGHSKVFYSVAQHSVNVCKLVERWGKEAGFVSYFRLLGALLHDASEGLGLGDIPAPIKSRMPEYKRIETNLMEHIAFNFGFDLHDPLVKKADESVLQDEWDRFVINENYPLGIRYSDRPLDPQGAKLLFLETFKSLDA